MSEEHIIVSNDLPWISHVADGEISQFVFDFPILADADVNVWVDGSKEQLGSTYSVTGAGDSAGGVVNFNTPPVAGAVIVILRRLEISRTSDFHEGSALSSAAMNTELDRLTMIGQELRAGGSRTLRAPEHDGPQLEPLPIGPERANRLLAFDTNGQPMAGRSISEIDNLISVAGAEAGATAAANSAEASAAAAAESAAQASASLASVNVPDIQSNHQASVHRSTGQPVLKNSSIPTLAHIRAPLLFAPEGGTRHHLYRPSNSGAWHVNLSASGELWIDIRMLGTGQEFRAAVRHGGSGSVVIDPGVGRTGTANTVSPMSAGEKIRIHPGESIRIVTRSENSTGNIIAEVANYHFNPAVIQNGASYRLRENDLGHYDGVSIHTILSGFHPVTVPAGFMLATDATIANFCTALISSAFKASGDMPAPRLQLPDREYTVSGLTGGPFVMGETWVHGGGAGSLRVDYLCNDATRVGLTLLSGVVPADGTLITHPGSTKLATIDSHTPVSVLPKGATELMLHNPNAGNADVRIQWANLEKI